MNEEYRELSDEEHEELSNTVAELLKLYPVYEILNEICETKKLEATNTNLDLDRRIKTARLALELNQLLNRMLVDVSEEKFLKEWPDPVPDGNLSPVEAAYVVLERLEEMTLEPSMIGEGGRLRAARLYQGALHLLERTNFESQVEDGTIPPPPKY